MKRAAANAAPPRTSTVASGIAAFEVGLGLGVEVCEAIPDVAPEVVLPVVVTLLVESFVGVASALLDADETCAE